MDTADETQRLRLEIERALRRASDPADVVPRLARLARLAPARSDDAVFAYRHLAELLAPNHPWRAALCARRALQVRRDDDGAWAVLAFCQTLMGNFRAAVAAYRRATASAPSNPWYAHNLGHLLDVALGAPQRALPWLRAAYAQKPDNTEIVASYTHALARAGKLDNAREILVRALRERRSRELEALLAWLEDGAPMRPSVPAKRTGRPERLSADHLTQLLERGLSHLPFDPQQRERALTLARDALAGERPARRRRPVPAPLSSSRLPTSDGAQPAPARAAGDVASLAAAVAYAIVYIDHVPLSQAEVAAPFRVGVARLRGRFAELRARLDLIPGDRRYATTRR